MFGQPIEYYDKKILWTIGDTLGRTLKVDANTSRRANEELGDVFVTERTKFARLCIDVDLNKILRSQFELNNKTYSVEYEGLQLVCFMCGKYGHNFG